MSLTGNIDEIPELEAEISKIGKCHKRGYRRRPRKYYFTEYLVDLFRKQGDTSVFSVPNERCSIQDLNPKLVIRLVLVLLEYMRYDDLAHVLRQITETTLKSIAVDLPVDVIISAIPNTLPVLDALYERVFASAGADKFPFNLMQPESVVMHMIQFFAKYDHIYGSMEKNWESGDVAYCSNILTVIAKVDPKLIKVLRRRKKALDKSLEGLGMHGLVLTCDKNLVDIHAALKTEIETVIEKYLEAVQTLNALDLAKSKALSIHAGKPPYEASHQRLLQVTPMDVHERLVKNKTVFESIRPVLSNAKLSILVNNLRTRIDSDKHALTNFYQLRRESGVINQNAIIAPVLLRYAHGFERVLLLVGDVCNNLAPSPAEDDSRPMSRDSYSDSNELNHYACISSKGDIGGDLKTIDSADSGRGNSVLGSSTHKGTDHSSGGISGRNSNGYSSAAASPTPPHPPPTPQASMELVTLKKEVDRLRTDLHKSKEIIMKLQAKEQMLVDRLSDQARIHIERGSKFENLKMGSSRPTQLIRQYGNLYSQVRVEALDALARLSEMEDSDDLKSKVMFSVIVLAFRSVRTTIENKKTVLREILGVPPMCRSTESPVREMLESIGHYMRQTTNQYNITPNVQEVCSQLYATLFDFPSLPTCASLTRYIEECVRIAWALSNQIPAYCIEYDIAKFNPDIHQRFHTSDSRSSAIQSYLWPALTEGENGPCVYKAIVIT